MYKVFLFAGIAAFGNAIFVYGQRSATVSTSPFFYLTGAVLVCLLMFILATPISTSGDRLTYFSNNSIPILIGGVGLFITFVGFYLMYSRIGANSFVYATLSILTTSVGVGMVIFKEPFNQYHIAAMILSILAVLFFGFGQLKLTNH